MRKFANIFVLTMFLSASSFTAHASGPACIESAEITNNRACGDNTATCTKLCFSGQGGSGGVSGCSKPLKILLPSTQQKMAEVRSVFVEAKKKNGGQLAYCLNYTDKKTFGRQFTIDDFLDAIIKERDLAILQAAEEKKNVEEAIERQSQQSPESIIDLTEEVPVKQAK